MVPSKRPIESAIPPVLREIQFVRQEVHSLPSNEHASKAIDGRCLCVRAFHGRLRGVIYISTEDSAE
jgi:hypothetical protein